MKNIEVLEMAKAHISHLEANRKSLTPMVAYAPLASSTGTLQIIDMAIEDNREQELVTRLQDLVNEFDDSYTEGSYRHTLMQSSKETLKKLGI